MPELPEVETVKRALVDNILDNQIFSVKAFRKNLRYDFPVNMDKILNNRTISKIERRAKYILIYLKEDDNVIVIHLGMSGKLLIKPFEYNNYDKHDHLVIGLEDKKLIFNDPRRFGLFTIIKSSEIAKHKLFANLGIEPLESNFGGNMLLDLLKNKAKTNIKNAIMDQSLIVGVGNIYACESLFLSKIMPTRIASSLSPQECNILVLNIKQILGDAIKLGGSTLKDYASVNGNSGYFQNNFFVYGRYNLPCNICNNHIKKVKQNGRTTFYCDHCQK